MHTHSLIPPCTKALPDITMVALHPDIKIHVHITNVSIPSRFAVGLVSSGGSGGGGGPDAVPASYLSQYSLTNF